METTASCYHCLYKPEFHLARHDATRHDMLFSPCILACRACRATRRDTHVTTSATRVITCTQQRAQHKRKCGVISSKQQCKRFVITFTVLARALC